MNFELKRVDSCADPESFIRGGPTLTTFSFSRGREAQNTIIRGPTSAHQRNAIKMAFRWSADDGPTLIVDLVAL